MVQRLSTRAVDKAPSASAVELTVAEGRILTLLIALQDSITTATHSHVENAVGAKRIRVDFKAIKARHAFAIATNTVAYLGMIMREANDGRYESKEERRKSGAIVTTSKKS